MELEDEMKKVDNKQRKFYVYYNDTNTIVGISGINDDSLSEYGCAIFSFEDVEQFIVGGENPARYTVEINRFDPSKMKIIKRSLEIDYIRNLDRFLTEVYPKRQKRAHINIVNRLQSKQIEFSISQEIKEKILEDRIYFEDEITVQGVPNVHFFFTSKNDPSYLINSVSIPTSKLLVNDKYTVEYDVDLRNTSLFTKKIFANYSYEVKDE